VTTMPTMPTLTQLRRFAIARSLFTPTTLRRAIHKLGFVQAAAMFWRCVTTTRLLPGAGTVAVRRRKAAAPRATSTGTIALASFKSSVFAMP
jgi:hypothetical protein